MIGLDQLKYQFGSVNIGLDRLNIKEYQLILVRIDYYWLKCSLRLTNIKGYLDRIILTNYRSILTNYRLRMTKTESVVV